jgi:hypothetical protein
MKSKRIISYAIAERMPRLLHTNKIRFSIITALNRAIIVSKGRSRKVHAIHQSFKLVSSSTFCIINQTKIEVKHQKNQTNSRVREEKRREKNMKTFKK